MKKIILFVLLSVFNNFIFAQNTEWTYMTSGSHVRAITPEGDNLWIGVSSGLILLDKNTGKMKQFYSCNCGITNNTINSITVDNNGIKWFGTSDGLARFDGTNWNIYVSPYSGSERTYITSTALDKSTNKLWTGIWGIGVAGYSNASWGPFYNSIIPLFVGLPNDVNKVFIDSQKNLLIASDSKGLFSLESDTWINWSDVLPNKRVKDIAEDKNGNTWVVTYGGGVLKWNNSTGATIYNTTNSQLPSNNVQSVFAAPNGDIWFGTTSGLAKLSSSGIWTIYNTTNTPTLRSNSITAIYVDQNDVKWIGTMADGIARFDNSTWQIFPTSNSGLKTDLIRKIAIDKNDVKWIGTKNGLVKYDDNSWKVYNTISGMPNNWVDAICFEGNNLWLGTNGGASFFNGSTFTNYTTQLPNNIVHDVVIDKNNVKWFATEGGLAKFDGTNWQSFTIANSGLPENYITAIAIDINNNKWIATKNSGIVKYDESTWTVYNKTNSGITDNRINDIEVDLSNTITAATYNGLAEYKNGSWNVQLFNPSGENQAITTVAIDSENNDWLSTMGLKRELIFYGDGTHYSSNIESFITSIAIDSKGNKWVGTTSSGIGIFKKDGVNLNIKGKVVDYLNNPILNGKVYLFNNTKLTGGYDTIMNTTLNSQGEYLFTNIGNCSYTIFAEPEKTLYSV